MLQRLNRLSKIALAISKSAGLLGSTASAIGKNFAKSPVSTSLGVAFGGMTAATIPGATSKKFKEFKQGFKPPLEGQNFRTE